jgi:hypothetical protein
MHLDFFHSRNVHYNGDNNSNTDVYIVVRFCLEARGVGEERKGGGGGQGENGPNNVCTYE